MAVTFSSDQKVVTEDETPVYVHCVDARCPGVYEEQVPGIRVETGYTFKANGGDIPGIERSMVTARVADEQDATCPVCSGHRDVSLTPRKKYDPLSGKDPNGLLSIGGYDPSRPMLQPGHDPNEVNDLKAQIAELRDLIAGKDEKA